MKRSNQISAIKAERCTCMSIMWKKEEKEEEEEKENKKSAKRTNV